MTESVQFADELERLFWQSIVYAHILSGAVSGSSHMVADDALRASRRRSQQMRQTVPDTVIP